MHTGQVTVSRSLFVCFGLIISGRSFSVNNNNNNKNYEYNITQQQDPVVQSIVIIIDLGQRQNSA